MYAKIFSSMYDGTLATVGPWEALITFQQLLVLADKFGVVDMTPAAISRRTTIPLEIIELGLSRLMEPDLDSRTSNENGRRIILLDEHRQWGWRIVNYGYYRQLQRHEERREYMKEFMRTKRAANKTNSVNGQQKLASKPIAEAEAEAEASSSVVYIESRDISENAHAHANPLLETQNPLDIYKRARGTKRPNRTECRQMEEWLAEQDDPPADICGAIEAFLADEYWRKDRFPLPAFRKQYGKYLEKSREVAPGAIEESKPTLPIPTPAPASPTQASPPKTSIPALAADWNRLVPSGPPVKAWSATMSRELNACLSNPDFVTHFPMICEAAEKHFSNFGDKASQTLNFNWLLKFDNWASIVNANFIIGNGRALPRRQDATPSDLADRLLNKMKKKIDENVDKKQLGV